MATPDVGSLGSSDRSQQGKQLNLPSQVWESNRASTQSPESSSRGSPEPCCAICLGKPDNKSFTNTCLHQFCFTCLKEWSKVKPECPLCKQQFRAIIHNVRSNEEYDEYRVKSPEPEEPLWDLLRFRFRYRTTLTTERRQELAMRRLFAVHNYAREGYLPTERLNPDQRRMRSSRLHGTSAFRRSRYERDLWVQPLSDITGRFREATPEFYRNNPAMTHRLVPWLNRELTVLLTHQPNRLAFILELILGLLNRHHILSRAFRETMEPYTGGNTAHFIHEFYHFARSPYDMFGFDENAQYGPRSQFQQEEVAVSELSESDIEVISPEREERSDARPRLDNTATSSPQPGPSGLQRTTRVVSSEEDSDVEERTASTGRDNLSSGEVELVGVVKPRHERTPEIITITDSEPESSPPSTSSNVEPRTEISRGKSLKKMLSLMRKSPSDSSSSDEDVRTKKFKKTNSSRVEMKSQSTEKKERDRKKSRRHRHSSPNPGEHQSRYERSLQSRAPLRGYWDLAPEELEEYRSGSSASSSKNGDRVKRRHSSRSGSRSDKTKKLKSRKNRSAV